MLSKVLKVFIFLLIPSLVISQENPWLFPIKPGQINGLSGTVGELRNTHFHTGLDIKTEGVIGLPVYASEDGYIARINISPGGYGNAIYIRHPNGYTTVYAHLSRFTNEVADYMLKEQYRLKRFALERYPADTAFVVKRGEIIGYSGNSGSSNGPHLHWDLRDPYQRPVNSMSYIFDEIRDNRAPEVHKIAFRTMDINARVDNKLGRFEYSVVKSDENYRILGNVNLKGKIGIEVLAYDRLDDSPNWCGISTFTVKKFDEKVFEAHIDKLSFAKQSNIYVFYNYPKKLQAGLRFSKLYVDQGNELRFYDNSPTNGVIDFNQEEEISIELTDSYGNMTALEFTNSKSINTRTSRITPGFTFDRNIMIFAGLIADNEINSQLVLIDKEGNKEVKSPDFSQGQVALFYYDLRNGIPKSGEFNGIVYDIPISSIIPPNKAYQYYSNEIDILFNETSLFDTLYLASSYQLDDSGMERFLIKNESIPLRRPITITLTPSASYDPATTRVYAIDENNNLFYQGGEWKDNKIEFRTGFFGDFTLAQDTVPPVITPLSISSSSLAFRISDASSGISEINASIDGEWVLMQYDAKNNRIQTKRLDKSKTFSGTFVLEIKDQVGNTSTYKRTLK